MKLSGKQALMFLKDVKNGIDDTTLRERYGFTPTELAFNKLSAEDILNRIGSRMAAAKKRIPVMEAVEDIRSGMDDQSMMAKYNLSPRELQDLFRQIISAGAMTPLELANRLSVTRSQVFESLARLEAAMGPRARSYVREMAHRQNPTVLGGLD